MRCCEKWLLQNLQQPVGMELGIDGKYMVMYWRKEHGK